MMTNTLQYPAVHGTQVAVSMWPWLVRRRKLTVFSSVVQSYGPVCFCSMMSIQPPAGHPDQSAVPPIAVVCRWDATATEAQVPAAAAGLPGSTTLAVIATANAARTT